MRNPNPTTRFYQIKPGRSGWARIWITDDGCISILSDWGNYGYWFGDPALEFRSFLIECDDEYIGRKFAGGKTEFDGERTADAVREHIVRKRRGGSLGRRDARQAWSEVPTRFDSELDYSEWLNSTCLPNAWDGDFAAYVRPHHVGQFLKHVWPLFVEQLKAELATKPKLKPKDMLGHVRITKAPEPEWIGVVGPLRHRLTSEPMIPEGMLVFGAVESPFLPYPANHRNAAFFGVNPEGDDRWDFEPVGT